MSGSLKWAASLKAKLDEASRPAAEAPAAPLKEEKSEEHE